MFLIGALVYTLKVARREKAKLIAIAKEAAKTQADDGLSRELYFELMDRAHVASSYVQMALGEHPVLARRPELMSLYRDAVDKLEDIYQAAGRIDRL